MAKKTVEKPFIDGVLKNIKVRVAHDEITYNKYVDADYRKKFNFNASKSSLPWLICSFERPLVDDKTPIELSLKTNNKTILFGGTSGNIGTVSPEMDKLTVTAGKYVMLEIVNDLNLKPTDSIIEASLVYCGTTYKLSNKEFELSISTVPEDAEVSVNGIITKKVNLFDGTNVEVCVIAKDCLPTSENFVITEPTEKVYITNKPLFVVEIIDEESSKLVEGCTFSINNSETVIDNGVETEVPYGENILHVTLPDEYIQLGYQTIVADKERNIKVIKVKKQENVVYDGGVEMIINATPSDATIMVDYTLKITSGEPTVFDTDQTINIFCAKEGYEPVTVSHICTKENNVVDITLNLEKPVENPPVPIKKITKLVINTIPVDSEIKVNDLIIKSGEPTEFEKDLTIEIVCTKEGYETKTLTYTCIKENEVVDILMKLKKPVENPIPPVEDVDFVEIMRPLIEGKACYSYLNCGRFFKQNGINEDSLKLFYKEFGYFVMSADDTKIWTMLNNHFGVIE